jgi:hypothetical protein
MLRHMKVWNNTNITIKIFKLCSVVVTNESIEHAIVTLLLHKYDLNSSSEYTKVLFLS